jgi:hypothetical protein
MPDKREMAMTKEDLEIYLNHIEQAKLDYRVEARGTNFNEKELKLLDQMAVKAMSLFHNPPTHSGLAERNQ